MFAVLAVSILGKEKLRPKNEHKKLSGFFAPEEFQQKFETIEQLNKSIEETKFRSYRHLDEFYYTIIQMEVNKVIE